MRSDAIQHLLRPPTQASRHRHTKALSQSRLGGYAVAINDIRMGNVFYRGVVWKQRPSLIEHVSYPPPEKVATVGRVNRIGSPMFYCSASGPAVFYELRAKPGDRIALSEWELVEPLWMHHVGYHQDALRRIGVPDHAMRQRLINPIPGESKQNAKLRLQLSLAFTEDIREGREYRYKQSIAINELLFDRASPFATPPGGPRLDRAAGTAYPAMRMRGVADNLAIWPEFVDNCLRIRSVRYVLVEAADEARSSYTFLTLAISRAFSGKHIVWQERLPSESQRRSSIALENGLWILRDGSGRVYDLH